MLPTGPPGFDSIYIVEVTMPEMCKAQFAKSVGRRIGARCEPSERCSGSANNGDFYDIQPLPVGFLVIHST